MGDITIGNEFAVVQIRKIHTRNGERMEIESKKLGYKIQLDAMQLESLTWQKPDVFSKFLETPFGPEERGESLGQEETADGSYRTKV